MDKLVNKLKAVFNQVKSISIPKIKLPKINWLNWLGKLIKLARGLVSWLIKAGKESIAQVWTLLGFFIAWLTLTGTAQQVVGVATILSTILWLITIPLREEKED
jgi:hypothetical protein